MQKKFLVILLCLGSARADNTMIIRAISGISALCGSTVLLSDAYDAYSKEKHVTLGSKIVCAARFGLTLHPLLLHIIVEKTLKVWENR